MLLFVILHCKLNWQFFSCFLSGTGGLVDAGPEYQKALAEEITKLQRLYGGGDLSSFPEFQFPGVYIYLRLQLCQFQYSFRKQHQEYEF